MQYPPDMDKECIPLCDAINALPGLQTTESCCGHGKSPFRVFLKMPGDPQTLLPLLYYIDACHSGIKGWRCEVYTDCGKGGPFLMVEGPIGDYAGANYIAEYLKGEAEEE